MARKRLSTHPKRLRHSPIACPNLEDYTAEETEFLQAMDRYKRLRNRPFPTWREALAVLKSLGYRKTAAPEELP